MSLLAVVNPSRRRRKRKASAKRRGSRRMTAKQLKYFGPRKKRRSTSRRRSRTITVHANPIKRRRRSASRRARRSFRRNPIGAPRLRSGYIVGALMDAGAGAAGAVAVDLAMTQAARVLPDTLASRFNAEGGLNFGYYAAKVALSIGLGVLGTRMLPGKGKRLAAQGAAGALTVQAYEMTRAMLPADLVLGYMTPGTLARNRMGAYLTRRPAIRSGMGAYLPAPGIGAGNMSHSETRIGEGTIS
jgi:hypothetical protein